MKYHRLVTILVYLLSAYSLSACSQNLEPLPESNPILAPAQKPVACNLLFSSMDCISKYNYNILGVFGDGGNKALSSSESISDVLAIDPEYTYFFIGEKKVARFSFCGSNKSGFGYPFKEVKGKLAQTSFNAETKTFTYKKPYLKKDGSEGEFVYEIKSLGGGKVEYSWNTNSSEKVSVWIPFSNFEGADVEFGGKKYPLHNEEFFKDKKNNEITNNVVGDLVFSLGSETKSFKVEFGADTKGTLSESWRVRPWDNKSAHGLIYRMKGVSSGKFVVDFGMVENVLSKIDSRHGRFDFWKMDATHVNKTSVRNLLHNPSFELGSRYWRGTGRQDLEYKEPQFEIVDGGYDGEKALLIKKHAVVHLPMMLESGKKYVCSFYARSDVPTNVTCFLSNAGQRPKAQRARIKSKSLNVTKSFAVGKEWKRYSIPFSVDEFGKKVTFRSTKALIDAVQIEKGETPTTFVKDPVCAYLTSSNPQNDIVFGEPLNVALNFVGEKNKAFKVKVSAKNIYSETLFDKSFELKLDANGKAILPLDFDAKKFGQGIFSVRADFEVGANKYTDYFRFSVMIPLTNTHPTKNIFGAGLMIETYPDAEYTARKMMEWGFGSTTWFNPAYGRNVNATLAKMKPVCDLFRKYKISNTVSGSNFGRAKEKAIVEDASKFGNYKDWETLSEAQLKLIEEEAYQYIKHFPRDIRGAIAMGNEEEEATKNRREMYSKAQVAFFKGAKRADPSVVMLPTHGVCHYASEFTRASIDDYITRAKAKGVMFDGVGIHTYWSYDINPKKDFDSDVQYLISRMKHHKFPESAPIFISECGNLGDIDIPLWRTTWADSYRSGKLTYDFGRQEMFKAAVLARVYITALKFYPKLRSVNTWEYFPFIDSDCVPILFCKTPNTLGQLYPDVKFIGDVRPFDGVRGYAFEMPDGTGIAAVWGNAEDVGKLRKRAPVLKVKFAQNVRFFDINGNERAAPKVDAKGVTRVPLTFAPLTIKAKNAKLLLNALRFANE